MGNSHTRRGGRRPPGRHSRDNQGGGPRGPSPSGPAPENQSNQSNQSNQFNQFNQFNQASHAERSTQAGPRHPAAPDGGINGKGWNRPTPAPSMRAPHQSGRQGQPPQAPRVTRGETARDDDTYMDARTGERLISDPSASNPSNSSYPGREPAALSGAQADGFAVVAPGPPGRREQTPGGSVPGARPSHRETQRDTPRTRASGRAGANGAAESNGHQQPPFALAAAPPATPPRSNGMNGAEPRGWVPRIERTERQERNEHPPLRPGVRGEVGPLIEALHDLFERDRATASQGNTTRCGICYLHFSRSDLVYREAEGFYVCPSCAESLGATEINMVRRQQE